MKQRRILVGVLGLGLFLALLIGWTAWLGAHAAAQGDVPGLGAQLSPKTDPGVAHTFQGLLEDGGSSASGSYDLEFDSFGAASHFTQDSPITETMSDHDTGYQTGRLVRGAYDLGIGADGYVARTAAVDMVAGLNSSLSVNLVPDRAFIAIEPGTLAAGLLTDTLVYTHPTRSGITNNGGQDLDFEIGDISRTVTLTTGAPEYIGTPVNGADPFTGGGHRRAAAAPELSSHTLSDRCVVAVTANNYGEPEETQELHATLGGFGFSWVDVTTVQEARDAAADVLIVRHAGSGIPTADQTDWLNEGHGLVQIGDWSSWFPETVESAASGTPLTITVAEKGHPLALGLPSSWTGLGYFGYTFALSDYVAWVTNLSYPNIIEAAFTTSRARTVTATDYGPGRSAFIGFTPYGSAVGVFDKRLLWNALTWTGRCGNVAVFDDPAYVETGGNYWNESDTVQASLVSVGHTPNVFAGISDADFVAGLAGQHILLIPELELADLGAALSSAAKVVIADFVADGGGLIIHGSSNASSFLNQVFGFTTAYGGASGGATLTAAAAGTAFAGGPSSIPDHSAAWVLTAGSLPSGSTIIYSDGSANATVALIPYGRGQIVYLGWDWFSAAPLGSADGGWLAVLHSAVHHLFMRVTHVEPAPNTHDVALDASLTINTSDVVNQTTVTSPTLVVHGGFHGRLDGDISFGSIAFDPDADLHPGELVETSVTDGILSSAGQPTVSYVWRFRAGVNGGIGAFTDSLQTLGSSASWGTALGDVDGDGDLDAFVANLSNQANKVWLNDGGVQGGTPGVFNDSGQTVGSSDSYGVALGDLDGDGDLDAFIGNYGQLNKVWLNDGGVQGGTPGIFVDSGQTLGSAYSVGVALGDVDGDGDLDAFIGNYSFQPNRVWLNDGRGVFSDSGQTLGSSSSLAVTLGDVDGDGDLDAFIGNGGSQPNRVWQNDGASGFVDSGQSLGSSTSYAVALGDVDGDGDLDAFIGNNGQPNKVWLNDGGVQGGTPGIFVDSLQTLGNSSSLGTALGDVDGDGDLDAFIGNGSPQPNKVWLNDGGVQGGTPGIFVDSGQTLGSAYSVGVALGDVDGDGDVDAFVGNNGQPNKVWLDRNRANLSIVKTVNPLIAAPGQTITYTLAYENLGPQRAAGVVITDIVSISLANVSYTSYGAIITATGGVNYTWQVADLEVGQGGDIIITGQLVGSLPHGHAFANTATIATTAFDTGPGNNAAAATVTVDAQAPAVPALVSPANGAHTNDNTPNLTWSASSSADVAGYRVDWNGSVVDVGNVTSYALAAQPDGTYSWRVAAYDGAGNISGYTGAWSLEVDTAAPSPPTLSSPANGTHSSDNTPTLAWSASGSGDVAGYRVDWNGSVVDVGNVTSYALAAQSDGTYSWRVAAYDDASNASAYTGAWSLQVDTMAPAAITNLSASAGSVVGSIDLTWTAPGDDGNSGTASVYIVRYNTTAINGGNWGASTNVSGEPSPGPAGSAESMTVSGLTPGQTYYFAIKTQDEVPNTSAISSSAGGSSDYSYIFLPLVLRNVASYADPCGAPDYCENYDSWESAYGPLGFGVEYRAYPNDGYDYYYFDLSTTQSVTIRLQNLEVTDGQLTLFRHRAGDIPETVATVGEVLPTMTITRSLQAGRYYVRVYTAAGQNTNYLYTLTVTIN